MSASNKNLMLPPDVKGNNLTFSTEMLTQQLVMIITAFKECVQESPYYSKMSEQGKNTAIHEFVIGYVTKIYRKNPETKEELR